MVWRPCVLALLLFALSTPLAAADPSPQILRLTFLGDIMGHDINLRMEDYRDIYRGVEDVLRADDLTVANLEFPVEPTLPVSGYPFFNASRGYLDAALDAGIDAFSLANNHAFDQKTEGIFQTLRAAGSARAAAARQISFSGIRGNPLQPFLPETIVVKGLRVGFIAATQFVNDPAGRPYINVVDCTDEGAVQDFLALVRRESPRYDLFIVSYHGDREYAAEPDPAKRAFFLRLLESGAHIVCGHHPHVVQGWELARVDGGDRLILYSMGNFISGMTWRLDPSDPEGALPPRGESYLLAAEVLLTGGTVSVVRADALPIANYRNARGEMVVGKLRELADGTVPLTKAWSTYYAGRLALMERAVTSWRAARPR
jgi:poly-gamma-glutamate synthesis protein (capsule biosynthesis protein)